jgi:hypothetical protein
MLSINKPLSVGALCAWLWATAVFTASQDASECPKNEALAGSPPCVERHLLKSRRPVRLSSGNIHSRIIKKEPRIVAGLDDWRRSGVPDVLVDLNILVDHSGTVQCMTVIKPVLRESRVAHTWWFCHVCGLRCWDHRLGVNS